MPESLGGGLKLDVVLNNFDDDLELVHYGPEVHLVLTRPACKRLAEVLQEAAQSEPGSLGPGSPGATRFTRELNDLLAREGNALFWDCAVDDSVGTPVGPPSRVAQVSSGAGGCAGPVLVGAILVLLVRGVIAFLADVFGR